MLQDLWRKLSRRIRLCLCEATVRTRRWFLDRYAKEAAFQQAPMRLYLTEDFHEAALAFKEKRKPGSSRGGRRDGRLKQPGLTWTRGDQAAGAAERAVRQRLPLAG